METNSIYRAWYYSNPNYFKTDKFPICFSTVKPYLAVNLLMLSRMEYGVFHNVPVFERFTNYRNITFCSAHHIIRGLTYFEWFQEMDMESGGYYVSWMFLFRKHHKEKQREKLSIMMMPVIPSEFIDPESLSAFDNHHHNLSVIKEYLEIWINPEFKSIHPYLYRQISDNIFPLLELEQIPIIRKQEEQMWEKAIVEYQKPNFSTIREATGYGEKLYKQAP